MWRWIKHWLDWVMNDLLPLARTRPHGQAVHTRYEKAGLTLYDLPVPWTADAVVVEVLLRLPPRRPPQGRLRPPLPGRDRSRPSRSGPRPTTATASRSASRCPPPRPPASSCGSSGCSPASSVPVLTPTSSSPG